MNSARRPVAVRRSLTSLIRRQSRRKLIKTADFISDVVMTKTLLWWLSVVRSATWTDSRGQRILRGEGGFKYSNWQIVPVARFRLRDGIGCGRITWRQLGCWIYIRVYWWALQAITHHASLPTADARFHPAHTTNKNSHRRERAEMARAIVPVGLCGMWWVLGILSH